MLGSLQKTDPERQRLDQAWPTVRKVQKQSGSTSWMSMSQQGLKQSNGGAKNASLYTHPSPVVIKPKYMAPLINSYLSVTEENFQTSIASFCVNSASRCLARRCKARSNPRAMCTAAPAQNNGKSVGPNPSSRLPEQRKVEEDFRPSPPPLCEVNSSKKALLASASLSYGSCDTWQKSKRDSQTLLTAQTHQSRF